MGRFSLGELQFAADPRQPGLGRWGWHQKMVPGLEVWDKLKPREFLTSLEVKRKYIHIQIHSYSGMNIFFFFTYKAFLVAVAILYITAVFVRFYQIQSKRSVLMVSSFCLKGTSPGGSFSRDSSKRSKKTCYHLTTWILKITVSNEIGTSSTNGWFPYKLVAYRHDFKPADQKIGSQKWMIPRQTSSCISPGWQMSSHFSEIGLDKLRDLLPNCFIFIGTNR